MPKQARISTTSERSQDKAALRGDQLSKHHARWLSVTLGNRRYLRRPHRQLKMTLQNNTMCIWVARPEPLNCAAPEINTCADFPRLPRGNQDLPFGWKVPPNTSQVRSDFEARERTM
jgi:hypothetical protein